MRFGCDCHCCCYVGGGRRGGVGREDVAERKGVSDRIGV